jgi:hypothetical protein
MRPTRLILAAVPALLGLAAAQAHAQLVVTPTFDSTWSLDPTAAADEATITSMLATTYDADFTNPVTVAIDFSDVNTGLGTSLTGYYGTSYSSYQSALTSVKQVANGGDGNTAFLAELPASGNPVPGNSTAGVSFTSAQGRALGLGTAGVVTVTGETGTFDSNIMLNMGLIQSDGYSLVGVAEHEIDEALGVGSALDGRADIAGTATVASVGAMDFFRYSAPGVRSFTSDAPPSPTSRTTTASPRSSITTSRPVPTITTGRAPVMGPTARASTARRRCRTPSAPRTCPGTGCWARPSSRP